MKNRLILFALCVATSGFKKITQTPGFVLEMTNHCSMHPQNMFLASAIQTTDVTEPWTDQQLMAPADLAAIINDPNAKKPVIICVGPGALIKGSLDMGPAKEKGNLEKLKQQLDKLPRNANVVIYCGCCPFEHCPNIRPAFLLLNEMKFSNAHLLNLEHNIKTDWIAKGYPQA